MGQKVHREMGVVSLVTVVFHVSGVYLYYAVWMGTVDPPAFETLHGLSFDWEHPQALLPRNTHPMSMMSTIFSSRNAHGFYRTFLTALKWNTFCSRHASCFQPFVVGAAEGVFSCPFSCWPCPFSESLLLRRSESGCACLGVPFLSAL